MKNNHGGSELLILLDMHAILHRGYHALGDFQTSAGRPTGALYGLYTMLLGIIKELRPKYIVGCYDLPEPTKRHEMFEAYKAGRKEVDQALIAQLQESRLVLDAFGINYFESPGFEADDLLGTIVELTHDKLADKSLQIIIASGDHDTLQLVDDDKVRVYTMRRGIKDTILYDQATVEERYGFAPKLLPDYKGLRGDPSDNIPGVAGIGEKTATTLIATGGTLEKILDAVENNPEALLKAGVRQSVIAKLRDQSVQARFSKELAIIRRDAPIEFDLSKLDWRNQIEEESLKKLTDELQFRSLQSRIGEILGFGQTSDGDAEGGLFDTQPKTIEQQAITELDKQKLAESQLMIWLLNSDQTNPTPAEVARVAKTDDPTKAWDTLYTHIQTDGLEIVFNTIEKPLMKIVESMNRIGITLDCPFLKDLDTTYSNTLKDLEQKIYTLAGSEFNINSPKQLGEILFEGMALSKKGIKKTSSGNYSTAESELEKLIGVHEIIPLLLHYRELAKLVNTYIQALPKLVSDDGRLRATLVQWGTTTGRMASRAPNLQNIPIRSQLGAPIRKAFTSGPGKTLVAIDYSQIELRIAAWLSGDEALKKVFTSGSDIHAAVASDMFDVEIGVITKDQRSAAKTINYGILYGMGANALRGNLNQGSDTPEVTKVMAIEYLDRYFETFPKLAAYLESTKRSAKKLGYTTTHFGRRRYFPTIKSKLPYLSAQAERMAINAPIQGTQADIIKLAMVSIHNWITENNLEDQVSILLQVHDELVFEIDDKKVDQLTPQLVEIMQNVISIAETDGIIMQADAKLGPNWGEMKPL